MTLPADLERVLDEDDWLRRLARRLVADPDAADDLAQDAWVAALASGRADRPWLFGVLRNLRRRGVRGSAREADARAALARPSEAQPVAPPANEVTAELALRRSVTEALLTLEEPYRTALFLRYVQDETLPAIARRTGVATSTAHQRVQRGLQLLRARLDRNHGGERRAWALSLLSLAEPPGLATGVVGGVVVGTSAKVVAAAAVVAGVAVWGLGTGAFDAARPQVPVAPAVVQASSEVEAPSALALDAGSERAQVAAPPSAESAALPAAPPAPAPLLGRAIDLDGAPLAGAAVGYERQGAPTATTDREGRFELPALALDDEASEPRLVCLEEGLLTLVHGIPCEDLRVVVAARKVDFAGVVVDPAGRPVVAAELRWGTRSALFRELGLRRPAEPEVERSTRTDELGRFELTGVSGGVHVGLWVAAAGFLDETVDLSPFGDRSMRIELQAEEGGRLFQGEVVDSAGMPVPGASVSAGDDIVLTDERGGFRLAWSPSPPDPESDVEEDGPYLSAVMPDYLPARVPLAELEPGVRIVLRLGPATLSIEGRVLDETGAPRRGAIVWAEDLTHFGWRSEMSGEAEARWSQSIEELNSEHESWGLAALADGEGHFELPGLLERDYQLFAYEPATATRGGPWPVAAGTRGASLTLAAEPDTVRVAGRVETTSGEPLVGVWIRPRRIPTGDEGQPPHLTGAVLGTHTDADGRFEFPALAIRRTMLELQHESIFLHHVPLEDAGDLDDLVIVLPVLCELQVELRTDPTLGDRVRVLDANGEALPLFESFGSYVAFGDSALLSGGKTGVIRVAETARTLVLLQDGEEVLRRPLRLDPAERTIESL